MARLIIDGFKSLKHAKEYADWFEEQGEQDAVDWMNENNDGISYIADVQRKGGCIKRGIEDITLFVYNPEDKE
jgi:hypothetical protein